MFRTNARRTLCPWHASGTSRKIPAGSSGSAACGYIAARLCQSTRCLERSPDLAFCYEAIEDDEQVIRYYTAALAVEPNHSRANGNLGAIYQEQGKLDRALPLLETAIRQNPQFTAARYRIGLVLTKKREFQRAATEY